MTDRTVEFRGCIRVVNSGGTNRAATQGSGDGAESYDNICTAAEQEFTTAAKHAGLGLQGTERLIVRLLRLVQVKGVSCGDPSAEIADLSKLFKSDIEGIHVELSHLKSKLKGLESGGSGTKSPFAQRLKHEHVVLDSLQKVAKSHTAAFQSALQQRTTVLREQNERRKRFSHSRMVGVQLDSPLFVPKQHGPPFSSPWQDKSRSAAVISPGLAQDGQQHGPPVREGRNTLPPIPYQEMSSHQNDKGGGGDHVSTLSSRSSSVIFRRRTLGNQQPPPSATAGIPASAAGLPTTNNKKSPLSYPQAWEGNTGNTAWRVQDMQIASTNRLGDARKVETTIGELGQMFAKFSALVAAQGETVMHIEDDVEAAHGNVVEGHAHLSTYYDIVKSNRSMIIKIFAVLIGIILLLLIMF
eukprot:435130_1